MYEVLVKVKIERMLEIFGGQRFTGCSQIQVSEKRVSWIKNPPFYGKNKSYLTNGARYQHVEKWK